MNNAITTLSNIGQVLVIIIIGSGLACFVYDQIQKSVERFLREEDKKKEKETVSK